MANLLRFESASIYREYKATIENARQKLEHIESEIFDEAVQIALQGSWREWERQQPVGATFSISAEELVQCDDPNIHALLQAREKLTEIRMNLKAAY